MRTDDKRERGRVYVLHAQHHQIKSVSGDESNINAPE